eukprot:TRINITY_DN15488_c0_g1_i1.p1 TRINITY_DN15488_c0_g1~~TRINITY_DN15488_c0_g1_i1.p1  ORF type:complete len:169 (+),score=36.52 TRINITY_DN15488_c0_g1_i1:46-552(+)
MCFFPAMLRLLLRIRSPLLPLLIVSFNDLAAARDVGAPKALLRSSGLHRGCSTPLVDSVFVFGEKSKVAAVALRGLSASHPERSDPAEERQGDHAPRRKHKVEKAVAVGSALLPDVSDEFRPEAPDQKGGVWDFDDDVDTFATPQGWDPSMVPVGLLAQSVHQEPLVG